MVVSPPGPASDRVLAARIGAFSLHAQRDARETTKNARRAFLAKFIEEVDPERQLPEDERNRRAAAARSAHFARMSLRSAKVRRQRKNGAAQ